MVLPIELELAAVGGSFIGTVAGTLAPYYYEKRKLGLSDVEIFFDKKFLKASIAAMLTSSLLVGVAAPRILENVDPLGSIITTLVSSAVFAYVSNQIGNRLSGPSIITENAKKRQIAIETEEVLNTSVKRMVGKPLSEKSPMQLSEENRDINRKDQFGNILEKECDDKNCECHDIMGDKKED